MYYAILKGLDLKGARRVTVTLRLGGAPAEIEAVVALFSTTAADVYVDRTYPREREGGIHMYGTVEVPGVVHATATRTDQEPGIGAGRAVRQPRRRRQIGGGRRG